jgi:hypothetical protein
MWAPALRHNFKYSEIELLSQAVAKTVNDNQITGVAHRRLDFLADPFDRNVNGVIVFARRRSSNTLEQLLATEDSAGIARQQSQSL